MEMARYIIKCLAVLCLVALVFIVPATAVCAADDQGGDGGSGLFNTSKGLGAAGLLGVGGGGAIVVSRNNRKRHNRMVNNKQIPGEAPVEQQYGPRRNGFSLHNPFHR